MIDRGGRRGEEGLSEPEWSGWKDEQDGGREYDAGVMSAAVVVWLACLAQTSEALARPVVDGKWVVPGREVNAEPYWGIKGGIGVGLWPRSAVRGLLAVYAPYLGLREKRVMNFIAIEPVVGDSRGYSELEQSGPDGVRGLRLWASEEFQPAGETGSATCPPRGKVVKMEGAPGLTFYVHTERFVNGARPIVQVILREDRPHEVGFRIFSASDSREMRCCILTATMGNYARLRRLRLKDGVVEASDLWPEFGPEENGFAPHREWPLEQLRRVGDEVWVAASPNEATPANAEYVEAVPFWWRYEGRPGTQYWRKRNPNERLVARVNGRMNYYGHPGARIPGGIAFENFELVEPFGEGQEFWFGIRGEGLSESGFCGREYHRPTGSKDYQD